MKRILNRFWDWLWAWLLMVTMFGVMVLSWRYFMHLMTSDRTHLQTGNAVVSNGNDFWVTNACATNPATYWAEELAETKQWYSTNLPIEWVGYELRYKPQTGNTKACDLGLRSDGVVVWRENK